MDFLITVICLLVVLSVLVFVHEGGHYLAARACGVRVTEFMLGLPGPHIGFKWKGTLFGVTAVPLGGYARVCGMGTDPESPHLERAMAVAYERGRIASPELALELGISEDEADVVLEELFEWGTLEKPKKNDEDEYYLTPARDGFEEGQPRPIENPHAFYESEAKVQYCHKGFFKKIAILLAGPGMNLVFAIVAFILVYSVIGFDVMNTETGVTTHVTVDPLRAAVAGFSYIGDVFMAILHLFNPATAAETINTSTSIIGIAVLSKSAFEAGLVNALFFMAMISVSLGLMNMLPIPPLDGGRFVIEIIQVITRRPVTSSMVGAASFVGMALIMLLFVVMVGQDIQRFVFGNW